MTFTWNGSKYAASSGLQAGIGETLIEALHIQSNESILDVGCGVGNLTLILASLADRGCVVGIDASTSMIEKAGQQARLHDLNNIEFQVMNAAEIPFRARFNVVYSNSTLHWVKDNQQALEAIRRSLIPGGRIGLQFPLLNATHPLIALAQNAIDGLQLENEYKDWEFPWFVPDSVEGYADLLRRTAFQQVNVSLVETGYLFDTVAAAYNFFDSVGLELYLKPLSAGQQLALKEEFTAALAAMAGQNGVRLNFQRLLAFASLPETA